MPGSSRRPGSKPEGCFVAWFLFRAVAAVVVLGVVLWAVIKLVNHFT